jgi:excisionase family DNA binding protein
MMKKTNQTADRSTPRLLSIKEATELLRVSKPTIDRYLSMGKLKRLKVGARTLIEYNDLINLIREA